MFLPTFIEEETTFQEEKEMTTPYHHVAAKHNTQAPLPHLQGSLLKELLLSKTPQLTVGC